jgi:hypothetical protein
VLQRTPSPLGVLGSLRAARSGAAEHPEMKQFVRKAVTAIVALLLLFLADRVLEPVPVPAATAVIGGLIGLWLGLTVRWLWLSLGVIAGLVVGAGFHLYVHMTGQSPPPPEGLAAHLAVDGGIGLVVALLVVVATVLAYKALAGSDPTSRSSGRQG